MLSPGYDPHMTTDTDNLYSTPDLNLVDFAFDQRVVNVFPDMIRRSVPAYETIVPLSALVAVRSIPDQKATAPAKPGAIYDLGCSRGATTAALLNYTPASQQVIGVDNSPEMIAAARDGIAALTDSEAAKRVTWRCEDIQTTPIKHAEAVVMNYTLQFVPPPEREDLLVHIRDGLQPGAPFVYAEKVLLDDPDNQTWADARHLDFKRANGYSELEIAQKRTAIENIMVPESCDAHLSRLNNLGFERVNQWFQLLNWAAFIGYAPAPD